MIVKVRVLGLEGFVCEGAPSGPGRAMGLGLVEVVAVAVAVVESMCEILSPG